MAFSDAVKQLRLARGWTQEELAGKAGIPQGTISRIERGVNDNPTRETSEKLARAFSISVLDLYIEAGLAPPPAILTDLAAAGVPDVQLVELARIWSELSPDDRETALALTRSLWERRKKRAHDGGGHIAPEQQAAVPSGC